MRFVTPGELEAQQASWEHLELDLPGSRISLPLPGENTPETRISPPLPREISSEDESDDDGQGAAKEARLQAMLDYLDAK